MFVLLCLAPHRQLRNKEPINQRQNATAGPCFPHPYQYNSLANHLLLLSLESDLNNSSLAAPINPSPLLDGIRHTVPPQEPAILFYSTELMFLTSPRPCSPGKCMLTAIVQCDTIQQTSIVQVGSRQGLS